LSIGYFVLVYEDTFWYARPMIKTERIDLDPEEENALGNALLLRRKEHLIADEEGKRKEMTLEQLSERIYKEEKVKLTHSYLSRIENGLNIPSIEAVETIAKVLRLEPFPLQKYVSWKQLQKFSAPTGATTNIKVYETFLIPKKTPKQ